MRVLEPSDEFWDFCKGIHQDFELYGPTEFHWIDGGLRHVSKGRLPVLRDYIHDLIEGDYTDKELHALYRSTWTELAVWKESDIRWFLRLVLSRIDRLLRGEPSIAR